AVTFLYFLSKGSSFDRNLKGTTRVFWSAFCEDVG
ncbi:unnamed protein product, partial [Amoebophrya sp. A120]